MTDDLLGMFAELNPVVDSDRLISFYPLDPPGDPVLQALLDHGRTNGSPMRSTDVTGAWPTPRRGTAVGRAGDGPTAWVEPEGQPTFHRRSRGLAVVGVAAAVITVVAGLVVLNPPGSSPVVSAPDATLYGDGGISCPNHVADDQSLPVGTVEYRPGERQIRVIVSLTDAAPHRVYAVALWSDRICHGEPLIDPNQGSSGAHQAVRITTDGNGNGQLDHVFTGIAPGTYLVNVNLDTEPTPDDPRHREMGAATFTEVVVRGDERD